jgi:hypothetical protein
MGVFWIRRVVLCNRLRAEHLGRLVNPSRKQGKANDYSYAMAA